MQTSTR